MKSPRAKSVVAVAALVLAVCLVVFLVSSKRFEHNSAFNISIATWNEITFINPSICEGILEPCAKYHTKAEAEKVIAGYLDRSSGTAEVMLMKNLHINDLNYDAQMDEIQEWLVSCGIEHIIFRRALSKDLPPVERVYIDGKVFIPRLTRESLKPESADGHFVGVEQDRVVFRGIDQPCIVGYLRGDTGRRDDKLGWHNITRDQRCRAEAAKAIAKLRILCEEASTSVLLNSLQYAEGFDSPLNYYIVRDGNWVILEELSRRRPIPAELVKGYEANSLGVFLGASGPPLFSLDSLLDAAAERIEGRAESEQAIGGTPE